MQTNAHHPRLSLWGLRIATFTVAAVAAASAAFWVLKWLAVTPAGPSAAVVFTAPPAADPQAVARLLGGGQTAAATSPAVAPDAGSSRFKLTGVVAQPSHGGYALIAVDGKPAKPYQVGAQVDNNLVLRSVTARSASLAATMESAVSLTLDLPKLSPP